MTASEIRTRAAAAGGPLAEARPRIKRDVLFTETPDGVLFHNASGGFHLKSGTAYRFASLIVPHLDGTHRVRDLCAGLPEDRRSMVTELVGALLDRGFARDVPDPETVRHPLSPQVAEVFRQQIEYVDHFVDGAEERFARFRDTRVALLGRDRVARSCALSAVRNGAAHIAVRPSAGPDDGLGEVMAEAEKLGARGAPADVRALPAAWDGPPGWWGGLAGYDIVVCTGPGAPRQIAHLLSEGVPPGRTLLPATVLTDRLVTGPSMTAGRPGCWACAMLRLEANGDAGTTTDVWRGIGAPGPEPPAVAPGPHLAAMAGNLLGYEIFRMTTGALPAETEGRIIVQRLDSLDTATEPLLPHPRCPYCRPPTPPRPPAGALRPAEPELLAATPETADSADGLLAALDERSVLLGVHAGVFTRFDDDAPDQIPLKVSTVALGLGSGRRRAVTAFDVHHVAGARMRALRTAAAVYTEHVAPLPGTVNGPSLEAARADLTTADPTRFTTASGLPVPPGALTDWLPATSLLTGERVLVPAAAVRPFGPYNASGVYEPTRAGTGTGTRPAEAVYDGLLSALSYQALTGVLRGTAHATAVPLDALPDDPEPTFLARTADNLGAGAELLDLTATGPGSAPVLLARSGGTHWAVGCDTSWRRAAVTALRDLLGAVQLDRAGQPGPDTGDPLLSGLAPDTVAADGDRPPTGPLTTGELLDGIRARGGDALAVETTPGDLRGAGLSVVRVLLTEGTAS
ncbi:TOMM precursor leader peptide-binding protein [Streptomyces eurocidicus]|uniref:Bacteriocin biosynthesis cyclodehydratase domain-containing protein n=1 Tax=Streptomyces eurocidicus TaxID=66423 RepID=A0A7W8BEE0_STREU|nr:TOMM precursor leader peptide-binding protein [Streptomyces eurocidicus]MBB5121815.1 bacteriocin biosynthesis cyclodehydratase domain-containing protein [Streptomyces eurocidicus]